jgi:hypothetical protein
MIWLFAFFACETVEHCTEEVHPSVTVSVVDYQGAPIQQAQVFFSVDGDDEEEAILFTDSSWVTTFEEPGTFRVRALVGSDYNIVTECVEINEQVKQVQIELADNSCHVDGEHLTFVFTPSDANCIE